MLRKMFDLYDWLTLADYDNANELASKSIVKRFARGNISLKNGLYLTSRAINDLSVEGDRATARLQKKISSRRS